MAIIGISAWFSCDECGKNFETYIEPAYTPGKDKTESMMDVAEEHIRGRLR